MVKVFVNGTFDVLHPGHIRLLNYARNLGNYLTVAIDTDRRVNLLKGEDRPINSLYIRREMLLALRSVDDVKMFDTDEELTQLIKSIRPSIMVVGSDYKDKKVIGSEFVEKLIYYERIPEYSSTHTIEKIQNIINR